MPTSDRELALEVADTLLRESPADETEVTIDRHDERFARFADRGVTQCADRCRGELAVRVRLDGPQGRREARATVGGAGLDAGRRALARALELAKVATPNPALIELGGPVEWLASQDAPPVLEGAGSADAEWIRAALEGCSAARLEAAGLIQSTRLDRTIRNSAGRSVAGSTCRHGFSLTATGNGGAGVAQASAARREEVDPRRVIDRAVQKAVASATPRAVPPGEYAVLLEPLAVSSILLFAAYQGFGAREVEEDSSFLCGRVGRRIWPESLSLIDDPFHPLMPSLAFDGEGTPKSRQVLVERGVPLGPVTDRQFAHKRGQSSSGHAQPQPSSQGPMPSNLVVAPGDADDAALLAGLDRGLLVTQFHYTNSIDPKELVLTGMTRNGTFLVEAGRVVGAVQNLRFTQSLIEALAGLEALGRDGELAGALFDGEIVTPPMRLARFRFTSGTDF